jgi:hypothetical protein
MVSLQLVLARILWVPGFVARYIKVQRKKFYPQALPLVEAQKAALAAFFLPELLDAARVLVLEGVRLKNPLFYRLAVGMGISGLRDMSQIAAITFHDVIVSHQPFTGGLLFHELVHVEQYRQLGVRRFSELYVRGFLSGGRYEAIPLEVNAHTLERQFLQKRRFSVAEEVARWAREERF